MNIERARKLLDSMPARSNYSFKHFEMEQQGSWHRQVRYALVQKEHLTDLQDELHARIELAAYELAKIQDPEERAIRTKMANAQMNQLRRQCTDVQHQLAQVDAWLDALDDDDFSQVISNMEGSESENWSEQLGREAGIELLSNKHTSKATLNKLSLMPLADYKKSVVVTNQFATFLAKTAELAERNTAGSAASELPTTALS